MVKRTGCTMECTVKTLVLFAAGLVFILQLGDCHNTTCPQNFFGNDCQYRCHCRSYAVCDPLSGNCSARGCENGWMGPLCQYVNLAYDNPADASPVLNSPNLAVDADVNTCFETLATGGHPSWNVDLGINYWISWIRIYSATTSEIMVVLEYLDAFDNIFSNVCNNASSGHLGISGDHLDIRCPEMYLARWVKVIRYATSSPRLQLCEVEVSGGRNVAVRQRTFQSSTWGGPDFINGTLQLYNFTSDLAVDGQTTTDFSQGSCTVTNVLDTPSCTEGTINPSWAVDLGRSYDIYTVVIYNRGNPGLTSRLGGFSLITSGREYLEIYRDVTNDPALVTEIVAPDNLTADGVLIRLFGCRILTLCEVEVYGDCPDWSYGLKCNKTCYCRDDSEVCGKLDGQCLTGCPDGYRGRDCSQVCPNGTYGRDCSKACNDNCLHDDCDQETGVCTGGCEAGWKGALCAEECDSGSYGLRCSLECSSNCRHQQCHGSNGTCTHGCAPGWIGINCQRAIMGLPFFEERSILIGALVGAFIFVIGLIVVIVILKRRHKPVYSCREAERRRTVSEPENDGKFPDSEMQPPMLLEMTSSPIVRHSSVNALMGRLNASFIDDDDLTGDEDGERSHVTTAHNNPEYYNVNVDKSTATAVKIEEFPTYMDRWRNNKPFFQTAFQKLPRDYILPCEVATREVNRHKNRYLNILPYDHCRVVLATEHADPNTDYINASYIQSYNKKTQYIASQGPNRAILPDFLRMIWEKQVDTIVMLTNLVEEGRRKCEAYWSCEDEMTMGNITVRVVHEDVRAHYTVRTLKLYNEKNVSRVVMQLHFTAWPDKGVPQSAWSLVHFRYKVKCRMEDSSGPILVHCSAGVGRTGTFIALENLLEQAAVDEDVDIFVVIWKLRQQRVNMVQTLDQYMFLHEALLAAIISNGSYLTSTTLLDQFHVITSERAHVEFKDLKTCPSVVSEKEYTGGKDSENRRKNRYCNILPMDSYRPRLHTDVIDGNDYINAVFLPSFRSPRGLIITQTPLPNTVLDFWRLVYEQGVRLIVMMDNVDGDADLEEAGVYWPLEGEEMETGPFTVSCVREQQEDSGLWVRNLQVAKTKSANDSRDVRQLQCKNWPDSSPFPPYDVIKSCVDSVRVENTTHVDDPVLIHCRDGARRSGALVVLVLLLDELETGHVFNVPLTVGTVRSIRHQAVSHLRQYEACYETLRHHMRLYPDETDAQQRGGEGPVYMNQ